MYSKAVPPATPPAHPSHFPPLLPLHGIPSVAQRSRGFSLTITHPVPTNYPPPFLSVGAVRERPPSLSHPHRSRGVPTSVKNGGNPPLPFFPFPLQGGRLGWGCTLPCPPHRELAPVKSGGTHPSPLSSRMRGSIPPSVVPCGPPAPPVISAPRPVVPAKTDAGTHPTPHPQRHPAHHPSSLSPTPLSSRMREPIPSPSLSHPHRSRGVPTSVKTEEPPLPLFPFPLQGGRLGWGCTLPCPPTESSPP